MTIASELPAKPELAYHVVTDDYEESTIAFATSYVAARRQGAQELDVDFSLVSCRRIRWADQYAAGGVIPAKAYIDNGWFISCNHCGAYVSSDSCGTDDEGEEVPHEHVYEGANVYCHQECKDLEVAAIAERARLKQEVIDGLQAAFPGVEVIRASDHDTDRWVDFMVPGCLGKITWRLGEDHVWVAPRDRDAWDAYNQARKAKEAN